MGQVNTLIRPDVAYQMLSCNACFTRLTDEQMIGQTQHFTNCLPKLCHLPRWQDVLRARLAPCQVLKSTFAQVYLCSS